MKRTSTIFTAALAAAVAVAGTATTAGAQEWEPQIPEGTGTHPTGSLLIQGVDSVWTAADGGSQILENADILIVDGVIREIGTGIEPREGMQVVDGRGMHAIPGLVDEHSHTAMAATNEFTAPMVPEVRVMDALDPDDFGIYRALSGGVTTARIMHGSSNPIGGQSAVIKMRWGMEESNDLLVPGAPRFVKFALGENVTRKGGGFSSNSRFPHSRQGVEAIYRQAFTAAQEYEAEWERYERNPGAFRVPPRRDLRMDALVDIMRGRIRVHAHSYRADEILMLMRVAEDFDFRIDVFTHVLEGYKVASEMAEHGAGGSTFTDWWQYKLEAFDAIPHNAAIMHEQGVLTSINTDIPWLQSFFFREIVKPVKYGGVSREDALKMLTLNPAKMMYMDDKVGSLEVGKQADVVLLSGSPFDAFSRVEKTIVDGIVYFDLEDEEETRGEKIITEEDRVVTPKTEPMTQPGDVTRISAADVGDAAPGDFSGADGRVASTGAGVGLTSFSQETVVALVGGTVHPVSRPPIGNGVVVIRGGVIEAVGSASQVEIPEGARRVDVSGKSVYPGMIDAITTVGIMEFGSIGQATDVLEVGEYNPHIRAVAAVRPEFANWGVTRANGITSVGVAQQTGVIQGQLGVVELTDEDTHERVTVDDGAALVARLPVSSRPSSDDDEPELEGTRIEEFIEVFERALLFAARPSTTDDPTRRFEANQWGGDRIFLEALVPAVTGAQPVFFRMGSDWEIRHLFLLMDRFPDLRPVVVGGAQAYRVADELAERDVPVVITLEAGYRPTSDRDESVAAAWRNAAVLDAAGVKVGFASSNSEEARNIPYMAAHAVAFGLPEEVGVRALTLNNAEILGQGELMGSLDPGKRADIIVTDGSPLQFLTRVERMYVGGLEVDPLNNKHQRLYEAYRNRR
jgi:imidazolonepropionase-like amidohydrolase